MGNNFILKKKEIFEHRRDKKFEENIQATNLLSGAPENKVQQFRCKVEGDIEPQKGMPVLIFPEGDKINVLSFNKKIGIVMSPDAVSLQKILKVAEMQLSSATIVGIRPSAKIFLIQLL